MGTRADAPSARITVTDSDFDNDHLERELVIQAGLEFTSHHARTTDEIIEAGQGAQGVITSYGAYSAQVIEALSPTLRVISRTGTGYDNIDVEAATRHGIAVCSVPGYGTEVVSDHAIALALDAIRRVSEIDRDMRQGIWNFHARRPLGQVVGRTFGVVGMGAIGTACARKAAGLGFNVVCWSRSLTPGTQTPEGYHVLELDELYTIADVISFHVALTPETHHLLNEKNIGLLRPSCVVVNTCRGPVIDTVALAKALETEQIWGAGLDVFETEPIELNHPIMKAPHTVLTSHAAYWSEQSAVELRCRSAQAAIDVVLGKKPQDCVNPEVLERSL